MPLYTLGTVDRKFRFGLEPEYTLSLSLTDFGGGSSRLSPFANNSSLSLTFSIAVASGRCWLVALIFGVSPFGKCGCVAGKKGWERSKEGNEGRDSVLLLTGALVEVHVDLPVVCCPGLAGKLGVGDLGSCEAIPVPVPTRGHLRP